MAGIFLGLLCLMGGCRDGVREGKRFAFPSDADQVVFGVSTVTPAAMTNRHGIPIQGLILTGASLITSPADLKNSKHQRYVVFRDFLLGNLSRGRYWQQQSEKQVAVGLPVMDTRSTRVVLIELGSDRLIKQVRTIKAAHIQLSVDTNDFGRSFTP
jgi:hypothetical protein